MKGRFYNKLRELAFTYKIIGGFEVKGSQISAIMSVLAEALKEDDVPKRQMLKYHEVIDGKPSQERYVAIKDVHRIEACEGCPVHRGAKALIYGDDGRTAFCYKVAESASLLVAEIEVGDVGGSVSINSISITGSTVGSISIAGGRTIVNGRDVTDLVSNTKSRAPTAICVLVPDGWKRSLLRLDARGACRAKIGDWHSTVRLIASGQAVVQAGALGKTSVRASGNARVTVASVDGVLDVQASGCAAVGVHGGISIELEADVSGTASIFVNTAVETAELEASGCAHVTVRRVRGFCRRNRSGCAQINILGA